MEKLKVHPGQRLWTLDATSNYELQAFYAWLKENPLDNDDFSRPDMEWYAECAWMGRAKSDVAKEQKK